MYCAVNCNKTIKRQKLDANLVIPYFHKSVISSRNEVRLFSPMKIIDAVNSLKSNECYNDYNCTMTKLYLLQKSFQIMKRIKKKKQYYGSSVSGQQTRYPLIPRTTLTSLIGSRCSSLHLLH